MMTLRELKAKTGHPGRHGRMMTEKEMKRAGEKIIASCQLNPESDIRVYGNGTVVFRNGNNKTVFSIYDCTKGCWGFVTEEFSVLEGEQYENLSWEVCLYMEGMDRIERNMKKADAKVLAAIPDDGEGLQEPPYYEEGYSLIELESCLENAKKDLSSRQEMIFRSYVFENKRQAEVAREAGISQSLVSNEVVRIRGILMRKSLFA